MDFENQEDYLAFKLLVIIVLFSIVNVFLVVNYLNLPEISYLEREHIYRNSNDVNINIRDDNYFKIDLFDGEITGLENIMIFIPMLWGFMKLIDLMYFLVKYK